MNTGRAGCVRDPRICDIVMMRRLSPTSRQQLKLSTEEAPIRHKRNFPSSGAGHPFLCPFGHPRKSHVLAEVLLLAGHQYSIFAEASELRETAGTTHRHFAVTYTKKKEVDDSCCDTITD
uniref:Uncharacterized protein n=1 Tax=Cryptomonas curvata TaxID=233186 RepID=A0A7S0QFT4_9CRYP